MTISFPVTLPTSPAPRNITMRPNSTVGVNRSPFTAERQVQVHQGEWWEAEIQYAPLESRAIAEDLLGALLALNGREGTLLVPAYPKTPRGTWTGTPTVDGGGQTGKTLDITGAGANATVKRGDWFQLGTGGSVSLHKVTADVTLNINGSGELDFWPRLRSSPAGGAAVTITNPVGLFELQPFEWSLEVALIYGLSISLREAF